MVATSTYPALYQAGSAVFTGLLVAVVINEIRARPGEDGPLEHPLSAALLLGVFTVTLGGGEIAALTALFLGHGTEALRYIVWVCAAIATSIAVIRGMTVAARRLLRDEAGRWVMAGAVTVVILAVPAALVYVTSSKDDGFEVYGTCVAGSCGLNQRTAPEQTARKTGLLNDGDRVKVICQLRGGTVRAGAQHVSDLWDLLDDGSYISDLFVSTSKAGSRSNDVPRCPPGQLTSPPRG